MKPIILIITLLLSHILHANSTQCKEDGNQMQMNQCAYQDFKKADKGLNKAYKALKNKNKNDRQIQNKPKKNKSNLSLDKI